MTKCWHLNASRLHLHNSFSFAMGYQIMFGGLQWHRQVSKNLPDMCQSEKCRHVFGIGTALRGWLRTNPCFDIRVRFSSKVKLFVNTLLLYSSNTQATESWPQESQSNQIVGLETLTSPCATVYTKTAGVYGSKSISGGSSGDNVYHGRLYFLTYRSTQDIFIPHIFGWFPTLLSWQLT